MVRLLLAVATLVLLAASPVFAQSARNVLLVINGSSQDSVQVGEHYARVRGIPQDHVLRIAVPPGDELPAAAYQRSIEAPIAAWLNRNGAQDRILFIVLTKGVPLRVAGSGGRQGTVASVDSELTLLYRKLTGHAVAPQGQLPNPYFLGDAPLAQARAFTHEAYDVYLVTRLDGFTAADAIALVDRAQKPAREGRLVLDMKAALIDVGNSWLVQAADRLKGMGKGDAVVLETTSDVVTGTKGVLGYYSWGSNDPAIKVRTFGFDFVPGAIAGMYVSSDGRTFKTPPPTWQVGTWEKRDTWFEGSPQSLAGDLIREGVTGVAGHVAEPFLDGTVRPHVLFPAYLSGFTLAEAFYLAMPYLSWQTVVVGDPLCVVASMKRPDPSELEPPVNAETELPRFFSARRVDAVLASAQGRVPLDAVKLTLKADARLAKGDREAAEAALVQATALEPRLTAGHLLLASMHEQREEYAKAEERYRAVLAQDPKNAIALNNLAYVLATHLGKPGDALPLAERAYTLTRGNPSVADTVAWAHHLLGNVQQAQKFSEEAIRSEPGNAEFQLHAAFIFAAGGQSARARGALDAALKANAELASRPDVQKLQGELGGKR